VTTRPGEQLDFLDSVYSPKLTRGFSIVVRRMFRKQFASVHAVKGSLDVIRSLDRRLGPAIIALNHSSWWDPLVCVLLGTSEIPSRTHMAPMDIAQLRRFKFMRKIGIFGVSPDDPRSLPRMTRHVIERFGREPMCTLWITPQGEFRDVRDEIVLRPGAGAVAARACEKREIPVLALAIEYTFWEDKRPEVLLRVQRVQPPDLNDHATRSERIEAWTGEIERAMRENQSSLAQLVMERDPRPFEILLGGKEGANHPLYDLWLRLRGKHGRIRARKAEKAAASLSQKGVSPAPIGGEPS
jgi:1-acyl-sn-glycerol-3-phosphate acyltransferase